MHICRYFSYWGYFFPPFYSLLSLFGKYPPWCIITCMLISKFSCMSPSVRWPFTCLLLLLPPSIQRFPFALTTLWWCLWGYTNIWKWPHNNRNWCVFKDTSAINSMNSVAAARQAPAARRESRKSQWDVFLPSLPRYFYQFGGARWVLDREGLPRSPTTDTSVLITHLHVCVCACPAACCLFLCLCTSDSHGLRH